MTSEFNVIKFVINVQQNYILTLFGDGHCHLQRKFTLLAKMPPL